MSHEPLLGAVQDVIRALQAAVDALQVVEHHLLSGQGQNGAASHVLHVLAGVKGLAAAPLSSPGVGALPAQDAEAPVPASSPPVQAEPSANEPVAEPVASARGKGRGRRARAGTVSGRRVVSGPGVVPPDAVASHCRACHKEVLAVPRDSLLLDQDGSDHAQSCPMSRVLSIQEERPAKARRKATGAHSSPSPPSPPAL